MQKPCAEIKWVAGLSKCCAIEAENLWYLGAMKRLISQNTGFTLLEVVVAVSILTVGLLAIATLQGAAIRGNSAAVGHSIAATVASDRMEKILAMDKDSSELQDSDNDGLDGIHDTGAEADHALTDQIISGMPFDIFWNVAADSPNPGNQTIGLIVVWNDRGRTRQIELLQIK